MVTLIGCVFFFIGLYCFLWRQTWLLGLLFVASIFEAASVFNIAGRGIQPHYLIAGFIVLRALANRSTGTPRSESSRRVPQGRWLLAFGVLSFISAVMFPILFAGTPVYDPVIGIDDGLFIRPPLGLSLSNVVQASYVGFHIATVFAVLSINFSRRSTRAAYLLGFYILIATIFAQLLSRQFGVPYPDSWIRNAPGYPLSEFTTRTPGPFAEASFAGACLAMYFISFLVDYMTGRAGVVRVFLAFFASAAVASSSSIVAIALSTAVLMLYHFPYSPLGRPLYFKLRRAKKIVFLFFLVLVPIALVVTISPEYRSLLLELTVGKGDSSSFLDRTAADLYALQLLIQTHGLGVGLGSNRASGLLPTLLSNVGLGGVLAFGIFYIKLFAKLSEKLAWLRWAGFVLLLNMCLGIADVSFPLLWAAILLAVAETGLNVPVSIPTGTQTRTFAPAGEITLSPAPSGNLSRLV